MRACTPLHPIMHGFRDTVMAYPTLTRLWKKYAHAHTWHTWDAVPAAGAAHFIDTCQNIRTQLTALQDDHTKLWTPTKNWLHAGERFLTWDHIMGLPSTEHDCPSWEPVVPAECELGAREHPSGVSGATMWLVQDHHSVADLHRLRGTGSDRWLIAVPSHRSDWKSELHSLCTQEQAWLAVSGVRARPIHRWTHPHTTTQCGRQRKRRHCYDTLVDWYVVGTTWDIDIHRYIATLYQLSGRGKHRATWYMPPGSLHTTAGKATDKHVFFHAWHSLREERKSLYQTRFSSRDLARNLESTRRFCLSRP